MEDYNSTGTTFLKEIKRLNETVPEDKYLTAYIFENGERLNIVHFWHIGNGVVELELVKDASLSAETVNGNDYCVLPPDIVLLSHITTVRIYFEYLNISETGQKPLFRIGF